MSSIRTSVSFGVVRAALCVVLSILPAACEPSSASTPAPTGPLPSWNDGPAKTAILDFVARVTDPASPDFVPEPERIATFDNDGTLWSEQPLYFQLFFVLDRVRELAPQHPEWTTTQPYQAVLENDLDALLAAGHRGILELLMATHAGMTTREFEAIVTAWIASARHPELDRPFTELVFQPMLELLTYLRASGFKTYIVSGGGIEFMRPWAQAVYGIPPEQVIGSSIVTRFELRESEAVLVRTPEIFFVDDGEGKPVAINRHIGRLPIAAFGNSDGDLQMLQYTTVGHSPSLGVYIHHDDAEREWAYDRESHIGRLDRGLDEAGERGWIVVSMKDDWAAIYPDRP